MPTAPRRQTRRRCRNRGLRAAQLRWLRQRNRCQTWRVWRLRTSNAQKICRLPTGVWVLDAKGIAPVFSRTLPHINDTVGCGTLRCGVPAPRRSR